MTDTPRKDERAPLGPDVEAALREVVAERGWTLVHADTQLCTAELPGRTPVVTVSTGTPGGLVLAIAAYTEHELRTGVDSMQTNPSILHGTVGRDQMTDVLAAGRREKKREVQEDREALLGTPPDEEDLKR